MTWALSESSGTAHVEFGTAREANTALRAFAAAASARGIKCVAVDGTKPDPPGSREAWGVLLGPDGFFVERRGEGDGARYVLKMTHVPTTMVEEEIQRLFERCALHPCTPRPSTLNPQPSTLNPQPSTFHPQPSTLNPQPSTLNPQPSTLNP